MIRLRRVFSGAIDFIEIIALYLILGWVIYQFKHHTFAESLSIVAFVDILLMIKQYGGIHNVFHKAFLLVSRVVSKNRKDETSFMCPYYPRSLGMGIAGLHITKNGRVASFHEITTWRLGGVLSTFLSCSVLYIVMFFRKDAKTVYDFLFSVQLYDKKDYEAHLQSMENAENEAIHDITQRAPIIKKDKK